MAAMQGARRELAPLLDPVPPSAGSGTDAGGVPPSRRLYLAVVTCVVAGSFNFGYFTGIIAGAAIYIQDTFVESPFWRGGLVSSILLGAMLGAAVSSRVAERLGRRRAIILQTLPFLVGAAGMAVGTSFWLLLASRTVAGVGVGAASTLCNLYISEISPDASRGRFGAWAPFAVTFGILVSYVLAWAVAHVPGGPGVVWRIMLGLGGVPALVGLLASGFLVESPRWLLQRGRRREAVAVVTMLYEPHADRGAVVERVVGEMEVGLARQARGGRGVADSVETGNGGSFGAKGPSLGVDCDSAEPSMPTKEGAGGASQWERLCLDARNVKPMVIGVGLNVLQQVCGINVVVYFAPTVLVNAGFSKTASILLTAGVGVAQLVATYVLMQLVDRIGRRPLNFIGLVAMVGSLVLMAAAFFAPVKPLAISRWLAVFGMLVFRVAFSLSLGPLPYIITPELFPSSSRTAGVSLSWGFNWVFNFLVSLTFLPLLHVLGSTGTFLVYAGFAVATIVFVAVLVPETAGRNIEDDLGDDDATSAK